MWNSVFAIVRRIPRARVHTHAHVLAVGAGALVLGGFAHPRNPHQCEEASAALPKYRELHVVGGHAGMLAGGGEVLKPLMRDRRGVCERNMYETAFAEHRRHAAPAVFMPEFFGEVVRDDGRVCLRLRDLTHGMAHACVMDIKVGVQTWDEDAPPSRARQEAEKYPLMQDIGFRFTGLRAWRPRNERWVEHGRAFGYALGRDDLLKPFQEFLFDGERVRVELLPALLTKLRAIRDWMEVQNEYRFYGSSLLFVYDGDLDTAGLSSRDAAERSHVDVRMIDFAHVWPIKDGPEARDTGYLLGITTIISLLEQLQRECEKHNPPGVPQASSSRVQ